MSPRMKASFLKNESFLLGATPFLQLALVFDRVSYPIEPLGEYKDNRASCFGISLAMSSIVLADPAFKVAACGAGVQAAV